MLFFLQCGQNAVDLGRNVSGEVDSIVLAVDGQGHSGFLVIDCIGNIRHLGIFVKAQILLPMLQIQPGSGQHDPQRRLLRMASVNIPVHLAMGGSQHYQMGTIGNNIVKSIKAIAGAAGAAALGETGSAVV